MSHVRTNRLLYAVTLLTDCAIFLLVFAVSRDLAETKSDIRTMGLIGAGFSLAHCVSSYVGGRISDRIERRRLILTGLGWVAICISACLILGTGSQIYLAFYIPSGLGLGMIYPGLVAWLSQGAHRPGSQHGLREISTRLMHFCLAWNMGLFIGQMSGGVLYEISRSMALLAALAVVVAAFILLLAAGPAGKPNSGDAEDESPTEPVSAQQRLAGAAAKMNWIANLGSAFAMSMIIHVFPRLAVSLDISPAYHGLVLASTRLVAIATFLVLNRSHFWHYRYSVALSAQAIGAVGLLLICFAPSAGGVVMGVIIFGALMGYNYFAGLFYSNISRSDECKGAASGIHEATLGLGFVAGALFGGLVGHAGGPRSPYLVAVVVLVGLILPQLVVYFRSVRPIR